MILDPSSANYLKPWLVRTLEPICDAEPGALAEYILALLKHNVPEGEMRKELAVQLDEFLEKSECPPFIDTLFTVLRTKSYLPYAASPPSPSFSSKPLDSGIPIPLDGMLSPSTSTPPERGLKRSMENDERDGRPPTKGARLGTEGQFSRYPNENGGRVDRSTGAWGPRSDRPIPSGPRQGGGDQYQGGRAGAGGMNGPMAVYEGGRTQNYQPPDQKRGICRDYHQHGYCARGGNCKYSHGDDAVMLNQLYPMGIPPIPGALPFMNMFNSLLPFGLPGMPGAAYDPHEARMDMRPGRNQPRAPLLSRSQQEGAGRNNGTGELPVIQDLTPQVPQDGPPILPEAHPPQSHPTPVQAGQITQSDTTYQFEGYGGVPQGGMEGVETGADAGDVEMSSAEPRPPARHQNGGGFRGRGGGRGTFGAEANRFRPERRDDKTLVVEKIPDDKLTLESVNSWFKKFGTVTNVAIDSSNAKALISFSNHEEAYAAWRSEDAVFNNRFVKVFWHRPLEGHGKAGARMLAASAPALANMSVDNTPRATPSSAGTTAPRKGSTPSAATSALAAKQQILEQQIAEQKSLMASLESASPDEKKEIMARLRKLGEEMKPTPLPSTSKSASPPAASKPAAPSIPKTDDRERKERERLDKELELHSTVTVPEEGAESTEDLKAKLEKLKAEAASLGISDAVDTPMHNGTGTYSRPYRGRGRVARSHFRGAARGGPPRASMKLDNRPKKLLAQGFEAAKLEVVRDWFQTTGQIDAIENTESGDLIVGYKSRAAAEQGLVKSAHIPNVGSIQLSWYTGQVQPKSAKPTPQPPASGVSEPDTNGGDSKVAEADLVPTVANGVDEEVVASGWGGDGDGEDGMGML